MATGTGTAIGTRASRSDAPTGRGQPPASSSHRAIGSALSNGGSNARRFQGGRDPAGRVELRGLDEPRQAADLGGRGVDPDGRRVERRTGQAKHLGALAGGPLGGERHVHQPRAGRRARPGRDPDGDRATRAVEDGAEHRPVRSVAEVRPASLLPAELTGQPGREPRGDPWRAAGFLRDGRDVDGPDATERVARTGGVEELRDQLAPPRQPEPRGVAAERADRGIQPQPECADLGLGVGQVEDQPRALAGQVAEELLVRPGIAGPPEDHRQLGLEQRPDGARDQVDGIRPGTEHDPLGADLRHSRRGQMAECRDLGGDPALGVLRPPQHDRSAGEPRDDCLEHPAERLTVPGETLDHEVRQRDPRDVRVLNLRSARLLGRGAPQLVQLGLDPGQVDRDSLSGQERVGHRVGHRWGLHQRGPGGSPAQ